MIYTKKIIRVFPRRTNATPLDNDVRINCLPTFFDEADEVHISVCFTYDMQIAEKLQKSWKYVANVKIGGPAFNIPGGEFEVGMYMKKGYVITSRGCPNRCWFCKVPEREGFRLRELEIKDGWIVTDDNLLACSKQHKEKVFAMLKRQKERAQFVGGLEAKLMTEDIALKLRDLNPKTMYFAYDTEDDLEHLREAGKLLHEARFRPEQNIARCYVLIGYEGDTFEKAEKRLRQTWEAGFFPYAMLYRSESGDYDKKWRQFQRHWVRPHIVAHMLNNQ